jgi:hypothetical protein
LFGYINADINQLSEEDKAKYASYAAELRKKFNFK